ncbi:hypothetical protein GE09DRAFT_1213845 [Coniochaeta sp. 2T2.1]|nr:hypothetical protein GE09DRAFT_1213845 [Coniochaeta sp. 2T2.1]
MAEDKGGTSPIDKPPLCDEHVSVEGHASVEGHPSVDEHPSVEEQRHAVVWDLFFIQRLDVGQRARVAFLGLKAALEDTRAADVKSSAEANATREDEINLLRSYLRSVHRLNMNDFLRYCHQKLGKSSATSTPTSRPAPATLVPDDPRVTNPLGVLWSPGFQVCEKPWISPTSPFWCQICGAKDVDLALLFKAEPTPAIDNYWSHNAQPDSPCWPWSAGSAVENQLLVTDPVCCDACSSYCIALGLLETSKKAVITTSLPAVRPEEHIKKLQMGVVACWRESGAHRDIRLRKGLVGGHFDRFIQELIIFDMMPEFEDLVKDDCFPSANQVFAEVADSVRREAPGLRPIEVFRIVIGRPEVVFHLKKLDANYTSGPEACAYPED